MTTSDSREEFTDEALHAQPSHNSDRKHDFLERITFVSVELKLSIG